MSEQILSGSSYAERTFKRLELERSELEDIEFYDCTFDHCSLVESVLRGCRFTNCVFERCDLCLAQLPGTRFAATRFVDSRLIGVNWTLADWSTTKLGNSIAFHNCAINYATFIGLSLSKMEITECAAIDVDFREADLSQANFAGTDLAQSLFSDTNLTGADLSQARNYQIDPGRNVIKQARFSMPEAMSLLYTLDIVLIEGQS